MSWPTGDVISSELRVVRFLVPANDWIIQALVGSMIGLATAFSWDETGLVSAPTAAHLFDEALENVRVDINTVGSTWWFPNDNMQYVNQDPAQGASQFLKADGATVSVVSYPDLYAIVGNLYGGDATVFNLPDLRGSAVIGTGAGPGLTDRVLGDSLGEEVHTLTGSEVPAHQHSYDDQGVTPVVAAPGVVPVSLVVPFPNFTSSSGGGGSHNNMQPSDVLTAYIQAFP